MHALLSFDILLTASPASVFDDDADRERAAKAAQQARDSDTATDEDAAEAMTPAGYIEHAEADAA